MSKQLTLSAALAVVATATLALATALGGTTTDHDRVALDAPLIGLNASR